MCASIKFAVGRMGVQDRMQVLMIHFEDFTARHCRYKFSNPLLMLGCFPMQVLKTYTVKSERSPFWGSVATYKLAGSYFFNSAL